MALNQGRAVAILLLACVLGSVPGAKLNGARSQIQGTSHAEEEVVQERFEEAQRRGVLVLGSERRAFPKLSLLAVLENPPKPSGFVLGFTCCGFLALFVGFLWLKEYEETCQRTGVAKGTEVDDLSEDDPESASPAAAATILTERIRGQVVFESGSTDYCIINAEESARQLLETLVMRSWIADWPRLILSVFGGAEHFNTDEEQFDLDAFSKGLVDAALRTRAWVVTGGTKAGVMDIVGKAMKLHDKTRSVPCIGVTPFGALQPSWQKFYESGQSAGRKVLDGVEFQRLQDEARTQEKGPVIQDNHTHSILCDSGHQGHAAYGKESNFRTQFELAAADGPGPDAEDPAPRVMLLVNGGMFSVTMVADQIRHGSHLVTCRGTGRAADALACLADLAAEADPTAAGGLTPEAVISVVNQHMNFKPQPEQVEEFLEIIRSGQMQVYSNTERLEDVILRAVLSQGSGAQAAERQLTMAVQWGCTDQFDVLARQLVKFLGKQSVPWIFRNLVGHKAMKFRHDHKAEDRRHVGKLIAWFLENHIDLVLQARMDLDSDALHWDELNCRSRVKPLEGLLLWAVEHEACDSTINAMWMHVPDPVHAALVIASVHRFVARKRYSSGSYSSALKREALENKADEAERLAIALVEDLATKTGRSPLEYIFQQSDHWGGLTVFHLAKQLSCTRFMEAKIYRLAVDTYWTTPHPFDISKKALAHQHLQGFQLLLTLVDSERAGLNRWELFSVPIFKGYIHGIMRMLFVMLYATQLLDGALVQNGMSFGSFVLFVWGLGYALEEWMQAKRHDTLWSYLQDYWNLLDCLYLSVMLTTILLTWLFCPDHEFWSTSSLPRILEVAHALNIVPTVLRCAQLLQHSEYFATLLITLFAMCRDALYFFVILGIFCATMACALTPILWPSQAERWAQGISWAFWSVLGGVDPEALQRAEHLSGPLRWLTLALLYIMTLGSNIMLVNLLIAIMNNTYNRYQEASKSHYAYLRVDAVLDLDYVSPLPPPFNLIPELQRVLMPYLQVILEKAPASTRVALERVGNRFDVVSPPQSPNKPSPGRLHRHGTGLFDNKKHLEEAKQKSLCSVKDCSKSV